MCQTLIQQIRIMQPFEPPDSFHFKAAQGWLELGNHLEANEELEQIGPELRGHPDVLQLRWQVYSRAKKWEACLEIANAIIKLAPQHAEGWIQLSCALHGLKRTQDAFDNLMTLVEKFPDVWRIPYNLSCYCAQLGRFPECETWFKKAMALDQKSVQTVALDDPDLQPLWGSKSGTFWKRIA
jgi:tetratricopeptide (TPR) repeat protein